ncbi:MAG TPA: hypothetical protein VMI31_15660, partial [Fimbriimonadaceae bacterium]|nr:hypothetical protein [Fimbriimonadaceae bacterium]
VPDRMRAYGDKLPNFGGDFKTSLSAKGGYIAHSPTLGSFMGSPDQIADGVKVARSLRSMGVQHYKISDLGGRRMRVEALGRTAEGRPDEIARLLRSGGTTPTAKPGAPRPPAAAGAAGHLDPFLAALHETKPPNSAAFLDSLLHPPLLNPSKNVPQNDFERYLQPDAVRARRIKEYHNWLNGPGMLPWAMRKVDAEMGSIPASKRQVIRDYLERIGSLGPIGMNEIDGAVQAARAQKWAWLKPPEEVGNNFPFTLGDLMLAFHRQKLGLADTSVPTKDWTGETVNVTTYNTPAHGQRIPLENARRIVAAKFGVSPHSPDLPKIVSWLVRAGGGTSTVDVPRMSAYGQMLADATPDNPIALALKAVPNAISLFPETLQDLAGRAMGFNEGEVLEMPEVQENPVGQIGKTAFQIGKYFLPGGAAFAGLDALGQIGDAIEKGPVKAFRDTLGDTIRSVNFTEQGLSSGERVGRVLNAIFAVYGLKHVYSQAGELIDRAKTVSEFAEKAHVSKPTAYKLIVAAERFARDNIAEQERYMKSAGLGHPPGVEPSNSLSRGSQEGASSALHGSSAVDRSPSAAAKSTPKKKSYITIREAKHNLRTAREVRASGELEGSTNGRLDFRDNWGRPIYRGKGKEASHLLFETQQHGVGPNLGEMRTWYPDMNTELDALGFTEREKVAFALANQNVSPQVALQQTLNAMDQRAGLRNPKGGGLAHDKIVAVLSGRRAKIESGLKIPDFTDSSAGRLTRSAIGDRVEFGRPFVGDINSLREVSGLTTRADIERLSRLCSHGTLNGVAIDHWELPKGNTWKTAKVHLANGEVVPIHMDFESSPSAVQYERNAAKAKAWVDELNRLGIDGGNWTEDQLHSLVYNKGRIMRGHKPMFPHTVTTRVAATIPFDAAPEEAGRLHEIYGRLRSLPERVQRRIALDVTTKLSRGLANATGGSLRLQGFESMGGTRVAIRLSGSDLARDAFADALGLASDHHQIKTLALGRGKETGALIQSVEGAPLTSEAFRHFSTKNPELTAHAVRTHRGYLVPHLDERRYTLLESALRAWAEETGRDVKVARTTHTTRYRYHATGEFPQEGEAYYRGLQNAGGTRLVRYIDRYRRSLPALYEKAFEKYAPGALGPGKRGRIRTAKQTLTQSRPTFDPPLRR